MNMYQLNCFITVCRFMSFTRAADTLVITQQGISKIISRMEEEIGVPLFTRRNSKLELTEYGKLFLSSSLSILREYNSVIEQLNMMRSKADAGLNLYIPSGMMNVFPLERIESFGKDHPEINLKLFQTADVECENALISGAADLAFCTLPLDPKVFTIHQEKTFPVYFMLSRYHPLAQYHELSVSQLRRERFITIDSANKCGDDFNARCRKAGFSPITFMRTSDMHLIYDLCQKNAGISFHIGNAQDVPEDLLLIPETPENVWHVGLATLSVRKPSPQVELFLSYFENW